MSEKKVVSKKVAIALGIICVVLAVCLVGAVANYTSVIGVKDNSIASLNSQIASKDSQISTLNSQLGQLQVWLEGNTTLLNSLELEKEKLSLWLEGNKTLLAQTETWLNGNKTLLSQTQEWLQGNITYYESQISTLNSQIATLQGEITRLNGTIATLQAQTQTWLQGNITYYESQIAALDSQIASLQSEIARLNGIIAALQAYVAAYENLRDKVNQRWDQVNVEPFITPQDQAVRDIVYAITGGWSNPSDWNEYWSDVKAMYTWVVSNIEYRSDGLYPMLPNDPSGDLHFCDEMWQFSNETLSLRKGDCEDMAILLCSMIRFYSGMKYPVECIIIESSTSGHMAVQIPVPGYKLVILDPAGKYYSHDIWGSIAFNDITTEINNWLNYWKPYMSSEVYVSRVFSDYIDKTFTSTNEYITWMYSR